MAVRWHSDDPELFAEAVRATAAETGFSPRMIEKDYFCTVVLEDLVPPGGPLTFKGGTCLSKVHASFHRLSEDLDFSIGIASEAGRTVRSRVVQPIKGLVASLASRVPGVRVVHPLRGSNESRQHNGLLEYSSVLSSTPDTIKIEIGLREPIREEASNGPARTLILHPARGGELVEPIPLQCLSYREAIAEKLRAALTRQEPAIRDFFDLDHLVSRGALDPGDTAVLNLLKAKLQVEGNGQVDLGAERLGALRQQVEAELRPVLRARDFEQFDLDRAISIAQGIAARIA